MLYTKIYCTEATSTFKYILEFSTFRALPRKYLHCISFDVSFCLFKYSNSPYYSP